MKGIRRIMKRQPMSKREHGYWLEAIDAFEWLYEWRCELIFHWWKRHETSER